MRNVLDELCMENQKAHSVFNNFFPKIVPYMSESGKKCGRAGQAAENI
jgi:hypothetical protein